MHETQAPHAKAPWEAPAPASLDEVRSAVEGVEGWLSDDQVGRLHSAAARVRSGGRLVEIGSFRGRSTVVLGLAAPAAREIVAIDPHAGNDRGPQELDGYADAAADDHEVFLANLAKAGVADRVRHVRAFSDAAESEIAGDIDLLFIDGAHRYRPARDDIERWGARVVLGGTLLIHDSFSSVGVTLALLRSLCTSTRFVYVGRSRSLAEYRAGPASTGERIRSAARQVAQLPWFARNLVIKALLVARLNRVARVLGHDGQTWPY